MLTACARGTLVHYKQSKAGGILPHLSENAGMTKWGVGYELVALTINTIKCRLQKTSNGKYGSTLIITCTRCVSKNLQFVCIQSIACQLIGFIFGFDFIHLLILFKVFFFFQSLIQNLRHDEITVLPQSATRTHLIHTCDYNMNMHSWK